MTTETQDIIYEKHHRLRVAAWITINRPQVMNLSPSCLRIATASFHDLYDDLRRRSRRDWSGEFAPDFFHTGEADEGKNAFLDRREPDYARYPRLPGIYTSKEE